MVKAMLLWWNLAGKRIELNHLKPLEFWASSYYGRAAMSIQKLVLCLHWISKPSVVHKSHSSLYSSEWIFKSSVLDFICSTSDLSIPSVSCLSTVALNCTWWSQNLVLEFKVNACSFSFFNRVCTCVIRMCTEDW